MQLVNQPPYANRILAALPPSELALLRPHLTRTRVVNGQTLHEPDERIDQVFFFDSGFPPSLPSRTMQGERSRSV